MSDWKPCGKCKAERDTEKWWTHVTRYQGSQVKESFWLCPPCHTLYRVEGVKQEIIRLAEYQFGELNAHQLKNMIEGME